jgi:hypothetical protein
MPRYICMSCLLLVAFALVACPSPAAADWGYRGVPAGPSLQAQVDEGAVSDGAGGAIVVWSDFSAQLRAQHIDENGDLLWGATGVLVGTTTALPNAHVLSDDAGGVIVVWTDHTNDVDGDVIAQRLGPTGDRLWGLNGVPVCNLAGQQSVTSIVSDGAGGAIVAFQDQRGTYVQIYMARVTAAGALPWTPNGVAVYPQSWNQYGAQIATDGAGGAIVVWSHEQYSASDVDLRGRFVNSAGLPGTYFNACSSTGNQTQGRIVSDGDHGAIIAWQDERNSGSTYIDVYAQRILSNGIFSWTINGVPVATEAYNEDQISMAADGLGGAIIAWRIEQADDDIHARRLAPTGVPVWDLPIGANFGTDQQLPLVVSDGAGGATILFKYDYVIDEIWGNRVDASGAYALWGDNGKAICGGHTNTSSGVSALRSTNGGLYVAWQDDYVSGQQLERVERVAEPSGDWGHPEPSIASVTDAPLDQGGYAAVDWNASDRDVQSVNIDPVSYYSVWRATDAATAATLSAAPAGGDIVTDLSGVGADFDGVAIRREQTAAGDYYWEWVGNQTAVYATAYSYLAPTRTDSVAGNPGVHYFQVVAHTSDPTVTWTSAPDSGYSVDNLAPAPPINLIAQQIGNYIELVWEPGGAPEPDFDEFAVYRSNANGVPIGPTYLLSGTSDTTLTDTNVQAGQQYYYVVTAVDIHGNNSAPSNEAAVDLSVTGVDDHALPPASLTLLPNTPNPFVTSTDIRVGFPSATDATIDVYDVAGRRVVERHIARVAAGWRDLTFDGRDDHGRELPSGVYFYRVHAGGQSATRKMVLER